MTASDTKARPSAERLAEIRHAWERGKWGIPAQGAGEHVGHLLAEVDALTAERDEGMRAHLRTAAILDGVAKMLREAVPTPNVSIPDGVQTLARILREERDSARADLRAAQERAEVAEEALERLRSASSATRLTAALGHELRLSAAAWVFMQRLNEGSEDDACPLCGETFGPDHDLHGDGCELAELHAAQVALGVARCNDWPDLAADVGAAVTNAETSGAALARLREVTGHALIRATVSVDELVAIEDALAATPTTLADAHRREWEARGMERGAHLACVIIASTDPRADVAGVMAEVRGETAKLRGAR